LSLWTAILEYPTSVPGNSVPAAYNLMQNYPNPFNPSTTIKFEVPKENNVHIIIYDAAGREVQTLVNEHMNAGTYQINWNAGNYSSGIYFYTMTTGDNSYRDTKKMVLVK
jgi:hypothetical protein